MNNMKNNISRRDFLGILGGGAAGAAVAACTGKGKAITVSTEEIGQMTYRQDKHGEKNSLLSFGCMRFPKMDDPAGGDKQIIDQEELNKMVDYAIEHGVNYFDTAPMYHGGKSEEAIGIALSRHPRDSYKIATKLSNQRKEWTREVALEMYDNSFKMLQTDYIDYYLLHNVGAGGLERFNKRFVENGVIDVLLKDREEGKIRNLGFSFHGEKEAFDDILALDEKYHWDFVQIQMNYLDWNHSKANDSEATDAEYLYKELAKRNIPVIIMEPLLGGRLANLTDALNERLQQRDPESSIASWAFRFCGSYPSVMTVLSGMTYMEHLIDNVHTYSPLAPLSEEETEMILDIADKYIKFPIIACTDCKYCMPCPYGVDIPGVFAHYNKCINEGNVEDDMASPSYRKARRAFLVGYDRVLPRMNQADRCIHCKQCVDACPQKINIPHELAKVDRYIEKLKINGIETK